MLETEADIHMHKCVTIIIDLDKNILGPLVHKQFGHTPKALTGKLKVVNTKY